MKNKVKSIERDLERYYETDEIDVDLANRVHSHAERLIERVQELERKLADRDYTNGQYIRLLNRHGNLREALEFYANSAHYEVEVDYEVYIPESKFIKPQEIVTVDGEIMKDYGSKAREALRGDNHEQTTKG